MYPATWKKHLISTSFLLTLTQCHTFVIFTSGNQLLYFTSGSKLTSYVKLWKLRSKIKSETSIMIESQLASYCRDLMRQNLNPSIPQCLTFSPLRSSYAALPSSATSFLSPRLSSTTSPLTTVLYLSSTLWIDDKYWKLYNLADRHIHVAHVINIFFLVLYKFDRFHVAMCLLSVQ